jgi:sugar lactone lactonase YvrE
MTISKQLEIMVRIAARRTLQIAVLAVSSAASATDLTSIVSSGVTVTKIAGGYKHAEGPLWNKDGSLLFSDVTGNRMVRWNESSGTAETYRAPSGYANGNAYDRHGNLYTAQHDRRVTRTTRSGQVETVADRFEGKRLNSPNDLVGRSDGSIYFTDPPFGLMGYGPEKGESETGFNGVYRIAPDGTLSVLSKDLAFPNGIAFSPDEKKLYVDDTKDGTIRVFDVLKDGSIKNGKLFANLRIPGTDAFADGLKVDAYGNVYAANLDGVWIFSPSGQLLGKIAVPEVVSNLAWGGRDHQTLFITADTGVYEIHLKTRGTGLFN